MIMLTGVKSIITAVKFFIVKALGTLSRSAPSHRTI